MDKFIIHIIRSQKAFPSTNFFLNTLTWNLRKNTKEVDFVEVFNGKKNKDGEVKPKLLIVSDDKDVKAWCMMNSVDWKPVSNKLKANRLLPFWNGPAYKSLPVEMQSEEDQQIDKLIQEAGSDCQIIHRYPSIKFRATQKIQLMLKQGKVPTVEHFREIYQKNTELADELRERVTWRDDPLPIDEDTGLPLAKEENEQNKELLNSYTFNANMAFACVQELAK